MRWLLLALLVVPLASCVHPRDSAPTTAPPAEPKPKVVVTPDEALIGEVVRANENWKIVVLRFPIGRMAGADQRLSVYRNGLKVGEVKVTGQPRDDMIAGDIMSGEARVGDQVRSD